MTLEHILCYIFFAKIYKLNKTNKPIITWRKRLAENKSISKI